MAKRVHNIKGLTVKKDSMILELGTLRLNRNLNDAQTELDLAISRSMEPFMPHQDGNFIKRVQAQNTSIAGTGEVYAAVGPEGRYLYEGEIMVDEKTGSPWARKGARKVPASQYTGKTISREKRKTKLAFYKGHNPDAQSHWFEAAEKKDSDKWMRVVDDEMRKP